MHINMAGRYFVTQSGQPLLAGHHHRKMAVWVCFIVGPYYAVLPTVNEPSVRSEQNPIVRLHPMPVLHIPLSWSDDWKEYNPTTCTHLVVRSVCSSQDCVSQEDVLRASIYQP